MLHSSRVKTETKNLFSTYRLFQIKTEPGNYSVYRSRDDFRWLTERLTEEYPTNQILPIEKGQLSEKILEDYFDYLINKQGMSYSRSLKFFLCTTDHKFAARKERDDSYLRGLFNKLFNGPKVSAHDLELSDSSRSMIMSEADENNLHTYLDELHETLKLNKSYFRKYNHLTQSRGDLRVAHRTDGRGVQEALQAWHSSRQDLRQPGYH